MIRMNAVIRFAVAIAATLFCMRCTIGPTAGTETGNPDISACLTTAMALFDSSDRWLPSTYLVEGETRLDPAIVYNTSTPVLLAKRTAAATADSPTDTVTGINNGIVTRLDTVVVKDTVFVRDTIVVDTMIADTAYATIDWGSGSSTLITQNIRHDSIFLVDTLFIKDTFLVFTVDTSKTVPGGNDNVADVRFKYVPATGSVANYSVERDSITGAVTLTVVPQTSSPYAEKNGPTFDVRSGNSCIMATRQLVNGATFIAETFRDGDGDGLLFTATTGTIARSLGDFIYRGSTTGTQLQVDFDAGADNKFTTTADNRISSLLRNVTKNNAIVDQVRYGAFFFGRTGDTILLQRDQSGFTDSIAEVADRFISLPGSDPLNHRENSCIGIFHTVNYRDGHILRVEINVVPHQPILAGQLPATGTITASIDYGKGLTGLLTGEIDYRKRIITGTYAQAGVEYHCTFDGSNNISDLQPFE